MAAKLLYEVERGQDWLRRPKAQALAIAAGRLVRGHGRFTILTPWRRPTSEQTAELPRRRALHYLGGALGEMHADDQVSVRDHNRDVVFRARAVPAIDRRRTEMADNARWGTQHASQIHYSQVRPYKKYGHRALPMTLDCSSSTIVYAMWSDAPDPSGNGFNGSGSTDSILAHLRKRQRIADAELGDLILWHNGTDGKHVAVVVKPGRDPLLASHGSENGPLLIRFSVEYRYHAGETATALDLLS